MTYTPSGNPATNSEGLSLLIRNEFALISAAFELVPAITTTGEFVTVFNQQGSYTFTLPDMAGTLAMLSDVATETTRAEAAEGVSTAAITAETTRAEGAEGGNALAIYTETARAKAVEATLASIPHANSAGSVVGTVRNLIMSVAPPNTSATLTADEIVVETALGGVPLRLASFNEVINIATAGVGGMDTGAAPVSGFVAIYAISNGTVAALLATDATAAVAPNVYGGAHMPAGYTYSALVSVWPTTASGQLFVGYQTDRVVALTITQILATTLVATALTALNMAAAVPPNAKAVTVTWEMSSAGSAALTVGFSPSTGRIQYFSPSMQLTTAGLNQCGGAYTLSITTPQTICYLFTAPGGATLSIYVAGYSF